MEKKLSEKAKEAILKEVKNETDRVLDKKFEELEEKMTKKLSKKVSKNLRSYLLEDSEKIVEVSKKNYKKRIRNSITIILEGYIELKIFLENSKKYKYKKRVNYEVNKIIRSDELVFVR